MACHASCIHIAFDLFVALTLDMEFSVKEEATTFVLF
jgi:hypothetical protein